MDIGRWRERVEERPTVTEDQARDLLVEAASAYRRLVADPAWALLVRAVENQKVIIGLRGHRDREARPGYYEGLLDGMQTVLDTPWEALEKAQAVEQSAREQKKAEEPTPLSELDASEAAIVATVLRPIRSEDEL